eukprot:g7652.t1
MRTSRKENADGGDFFVDHTCIDCDACRWLCPSVFKRIGDKSAVVKQPLTQSERVASIQAYLSCPTSSIHMESFNKGELESIQETFPIEVSNCEDIFYCGFADEKTFGASSYLIRRAHGNLLVDCPRFIPVLIKRLESMGGIDYIFITHKDNIGDHEKWASYFNAKRIIHKHDVEMSTQSCEIQLDGNGPWSVGLNEDKNELEIIYTPGHTKGSICLLHKPSSTIFTGDHFAYSGVIEGLSVFARFNHYSVDKQYENLLKLTEYNFVRVLPAHGRKIEVESSEAMNKLIRDFVADNST